MNSVVVIGGGAAGLMAACTAAGNGKRVILLEKQSKPARKLMISGKGRCNLTNDTDMDGLISAVTRNGRFLYSAFSRFSPSDTMNFFESAGVPMKVERGRRVFPQSDKAVDIVDALVGSTKKSGVRFVRAEAAGIICRDGAVAGVKTSDGREFEADSVIIATGGLSYPLTGSTGDGYRFARELGHTVTDLSPSLVPIETEEKWCSRLQGLSLRNCTLTVYKKGLKKPVFSELGEMLFTHYGISGPLVLSASAHMEQAAIGGYVISIDMKPALDDVALDKRIQRDFEKYANKKFINALGDLLPAKLIPVAAELSGIAPDTKVNGITKKQRGEFGALLKDLRITPTAFRPVEEAIVTRGGVSVKEIDPATMQSKIVPGLFFAGEVIDVDAYTGGFNIQIAFSTGRLAGENA